MAEVDDVLRALLGPQWPEWESEDDEEVKKIKFLTRFQRFDVYFTVVGKDPQLWVVGKCNACRNVHLIRSQDVGEFRRNQDSIAEYSPQVQGAFRRGLKLCPKGRTRTRK